MSAPAVDNEPGSIDCIYINIHSQSDFRIYRMTRDGEIKDQLLGIAEDLVRGCYDVVSLNTSKHSSVLVFSTHLTRHELQEKGFPFRPQRTYNYVG